MKTKLNLTIVTLLLAVSNLSAATHYVSLGSISPTPPYTNWVTAATNIQDAVNAAAAGDAITVTNGVYPGGVTVTNSLALRSVNGPQFTVINGRGASRCASLTSGASLTGFTLTNGYCHVYGMNGGGVLCNTNAFLTNCVISGNSVRGVAVLSGRHALFMPSLGGGVYGGTLYNCILTGNSADSGGGADRCTLYNCTLSGNWTVDSQGSISGYHYISLGRGGGAGVCRLYDCTLTGNSAHFSGGTVGGTLYNCIVCSNTGANYDDTSSVLNYCCTTPMPTNGVGNITNEPAFVNAAAGDFHLQPNSPCINAGNNAYVTTATDLDGNPRIVGGTVDMGAYEFQPGVSGGRFGSLACSPLTGFSFTFSGATIGQPYRIQTSPSPAAGSWTDLTNFTYTGPVFISDPSAVTGPKKFYRAVSP